MRYGSRWMVENEPDFIRAEYALNEVGGFSATFGGRRLYLVGTGEKGFCWMRLRARGAPGHGSTPHDRNAVVSLANAVARVASGRLSTAVRPAARAFIEAAARALGLPGGLLLRARLYEPARTPALAALSLIDPERARLFHAMLHATVSPTGLRAGEKENVIPSEAEAVLDGRFLPGTTRESLVAEVASLAGPGIEIEMIDSGMPTEFPLDSALFRTIAEALPRHDPGGEAVPWLNVAFTDATHLARLGIRCYGFYPLRLPPDLPFASLFHGHDERVPLEGYRFGFKLFYDVVRSFATGEGAAG